MTDIKEFLEHSGVKGMKWGQHIVAVGDTKGGPSKLMLHPDAPNPKGRAEKKEFNAAVTKTLAVHTKAINTAVTSLNEGKAQAMMRKISPTASNDAKIKAWGKISDQLRSEMNALDPDYTHEPGFDFSTGDLIVVSSPKELQHAAVASHSVRSVIKIKYDVDGQYVSASASEPVVQHADLLGKTLAHFGVKGMRWGIRRERGSDGTVTGVKKHDDESFDIPSLHKMPAGSIAAVHVGDSSPKLMKKRDDGRWEETHLSADAERFSKTRHKSEHELSDREIKEATSRAEAIKKYNDLFGHNPNKELEDAVARLELEKKYGTLRAELHPSAGAKIARLVKASAPLFGAATSFALSPAGDQLKKYIVKEFASAFKAPTAAGVKAATAAARTQAGQTGPTPSSARRAQFIKNAGAARARRNKNTVHNVTTVGGKGLAVGGP